MDIYNKMPFAVICCDILCNDKWFKLLLCPYIQPPGRQKVKKNIFNRLSQAVEEMRKEGHKVRIWDSYIGRMCPEKVGG